MAEASSGMFPSARSIGAATPCVVRTVFFTFSTEILDFGLPEG
jgi:hypothetical protein